MPPGTTRKHKVFVPLLLGPRDEAAGGAIRRSVDDGRSTAAYSAILPIPHDCAIACDGTVTRDTITSPSRRVPSPKLPPSP